MGDENRARMLLQYLEPSPTVDAADPARLADHLAGAIAQLPVTDLALGWKLRPEVAEAVRVAIPTEVAVWRWVPLFVDSDAMLPSDAHVAIGPSGAAPPPFHGLADFRFLCLDHDEVIAAGLDRSVALAREIDADGVLLDRIRWHSPSQSPASELTCFCAHSRESAARDGLDLGVVADEVIAAKGTLAGRRSLVGSLLGHSAADALDDFLEWRAERVTTAVTRVVAGLHAAGLRSTLDVFTPALAHSVGQDLAALTEHGEWSKSMTYLDAVGPASMPFELRGYAAWLEEAGETDAAGFLADLLGFSAPGLGDKGPQLDALRREMARLSGSMGEAKSVVGIDAVQIPSVCDVDEGDLAARVCAIRAEGLGIAPCWELLAISEDRLASIARAWQQRSA